MIMGYVAPNSEADFFKATGLSPNYENTLYFATDTAKDTYFDSRGGFHAYQLTYQRENINRIRVECNIANLYTCDYMRFKNTSFENKWFYAFVLEVNYINNVTTEVVYAIDPLMTWMGTFSFEPCYVERQHTTHDYIGANICDEGLSTGPYIQEGCESSKNFGGGNCTIRLQWANPDEAAANSFGSIYNPTKFVDSDSPSAIANRISGDGGLVSQNLGDNIVNVYMVPKDFANPAINYITMNIKKPYSTIAGYKPKNNKLFVYPYKYLEVDNSEGSSKQFRYEYFNSLPDTESTGTCNFDITGNTVNSVELVTAPIGYNGYDSESTDWTNSLSMTDFPTCAWTTDVYQAYLAQKNAYYVHDYAQSVTQGAIAGLAASMPSKGGLANVYKNGETTNPALATSSSTALATMSQSTPAITAAALQGAAMGAVGGSAVGPVGTIGGAIAGAGIGAGVAGLSAIANNMVDNLIQPEGGSRMHGASASNALFQIGLKKFNYRKMSITKNYAMMIDNYFTMYGYKIRQVLTPNMNARPHFTYVKTIGCNITGALPAQDRQAIENIFDNGVRFWHSLSEMGNYNLDNSPS